MPLRKKADINLKTTAYYEPRADFNVSFSSADRETAILRFNVTQEGHPLLLGKENSKSSIKLVHSNGSKITEKLEIVDGLNGVLQVKLPNDLVKMPGSVTAQVYVAQSSDIEENKAIVAERIFSFTIEKSLAWKFDGETKLNYIIEFDELEEEIHGRIKQIEEAMENGKDYISQIEQAKDDALYSIDIKADNLEKNFKNYVSDSKKDISTIKNNATEDITTTAKNAKTSVQDTADSAVNKINTKAEEATEHVDEKVTEFNQTVADNDFLSSEILGEELNNLEWQKYKLTESDGQRIRVPDTDPVDLNSGFYQMWKMKNAPYEDENNGQYWNVDIITAYDNIKQIIATTSYDGRMFKKNIHKGEDRGWKELTNNQTDTGWVPFNTINGVKKNTKFGSLKGIQCAYRKIVNNGVETCSIRVNVENFTNDTQITTLPKGFTKELQTFYLRSSTNRGLLSAYISSNGEVKINIPDFEKDSWASNDYAYGSFTWIN